jgi:hypothetical protein
MEIEKLKNELEDELYELDNIENNQLDDVENDEESDSCDCENYNYPDFCLEPNEEAMNVGVSEGSSLLGFVGALNVLELSEKNIVDLIKLKMTLQYELEVTKLQLEASKHLSDVENNKISI